jgi:hypothetical protein
MDTVQLIGSTVTKDQITTETNNDDGKTKDGKKKAFIRILYTMSHGGAEATTQFLGPYFPLANPQGWRDKCVYIGNFGLDPSDPDHASDVNLPVGHPQYDLVFFNGCYSFKGSAPEQTRIVFNAKCVIGWQGEGFKKNAKNVQSELAKAVERYADDLAKGKPVGMIGDFAYAEMRKKISDSVGDLGKYP